jgi:hypothetical protein
MAASPAFAGPSELTVELPDLLAGVAGPGADLLGEIELEIPPEQLPHVLRPAPIARGIGALGAPVAESLHQPGQLGVRQPVGEPESAAGPAHPAQFARDRGVIRDEHGAVRRGHHVEAGGRVREPLGVSHVEPHR